MDHYEQMLLDQIPAPSDQYEICAGDTINGRRIIYIYFPYLDRSVGYCLDKDGKIEEYRY